jgi:hypothetical protein
VRYRPECVPEGQVRVARRFIAGSATMGARPGGTLECRRVISPKDIVLQSGYRVSLEKLTYSSWKLLSR